MEPLPLTPTFKPRTPTPTTPSLGTPDRSLDPLWKPPTLLQTVTDPPTAFMDPIRPLPPAMYYTTLYSMADISKQISKSQKK
jgi:hypothetical protein